MMDNARFGTSTTDQCWSRVVLLVDWPVQEKATRALAGGAFMASVRRGDIERAEHMAAIMMQSAWRGKKARQDMIAQKNASTLIKVAMCHRLRARLCTADWNCGRGRGITAP